MHQLRMSVGVFMTALMLLSSGGLQARMQDAPADSTSGSRVTQEVSPTTGETPADPEAAKPTEPAEPPAPPVEEEFEPAPVATEEIPADPVDEGDPPTGPPVGDEPVSDPAPLEELVDDEPVLEEEDPVVEDASTTAPPDPLDDETVNEEPGPTATSAPVPKDVDSTPEASQVRTTTRSTDFSLTSQNDPWQDETLTVTVLDPDGNPLPKAYVTVRNTDWMLSGEGVTDANGVVVIRALGGASRYEVFVSADGGLWGQGAVANNESNQMNVTIQMEGNDDPESGSIALQALHFESGEFARDATYYIYDASGTLVHTVVGEPGNHTTYLDGITAGFYTVVVTSVEFGTGYGQFFVPQADTVTILFRDRAPISYNLTVFDAGNGDSIAGANVEIFGGNGDLMVSGTTNANGVMTTNLLNKGYAYEEFVVSVTHASYVPASQAFTVDNPTQPKHMEIGLEPVPPTTITVVDEVSSGIPDASVTVIPADGGEPVTGKTDADGNFHIHGLVDGAYTVTVTKDGYETGNATFTYPIESPILVQLVMENATEAVYITFLVYDRRSGKPIEGATLVAVDRYDQFVTQGISGPDGSWTTRNDGTAHSVLISAPGYADWSVLFPPVESGIESLSAPLYQLVTGVLVDDVTGEPIANAEITLWEPGSAATRYVTTGDDGSFSFFFNPYPHGEVIRFRAWSSPAYEVTTFDIIMDSAVPFIELRVSPVIQGNDGSGNSDSQGTLTTSFSLCANEDCSELSTAADGSTVTWTVTGQNDSAFQPNTGTMAVASAGHGGTSTTLLAQVAQEHTITAVLDGGIATGSLDLPVGNYTVCLQPVLTGADGSTIQIADEAACDTVQLTQDGIAGGPLAFGVVADGGVTVIRPDAAAQEQDGSTDTPATGADGNDAGDATTGKTDEAVDSTPDGTSVDVSGLPSTGTGPVETSSQAWILATIALVLGAAALSMRGRFRM